MRKVSYYIFLLVAVGATTVSYWIYQQYFQTTEQSFLYFKAERADIQETVRTRGEVVVEKEFDLEFPFSGTVEAVYVREGDTVSRGARLVKLETKDFEIQTEELQAVVLQRKADLSKIISGATPEDIKVSESKLASAEIGLDEARKNLVDKIRDLYVKSDDAIRAKIDQLFDNPNSGSPSLNIPVESNIKQSLNGDRLALETIFKNWNTEMMNISTGKDLEPFILNAKSNSSSVSKLLNMLSSVVNDLTANSTLTQTTIDKYKSDISTARVNINTAVTALITAEEKLNLAVANATLYKNELALKRTPARSEDIAIAEARIREAESRLSAVRENIKKSTLYAGVGGRVSKVHYEVGEVSRPGQPVLSMTSDGYKLQADVSELDIAKISESEDNNVRVELDAFPGKTLEGRVVSIDEKEVIKTEDKYYRLNISFNALSLAVRPGMSADATILSSVHKNALRIQELAIYTEGRSKYLKILKPGLDKAMSEDSLQKVTVTTGISDGEFVEILSGLEDGQTAVVGAE